MIQVPSDEKCAWDRLKLNLQLERGAMYLGSKLEESPEPFVSARVGNPNEKWKSLCMRLAT